LSAARDRYSVRKSVPRQKLLAVLRLIRRARGPEYAVRIDVLAAEVGIHRRAVQQIATYLTRERHLPIGSLWTKPYGYYWIVDEADRRRNRSRFIRRALEILRHGEALDDEEIRAAIGPTIHQLELLADQFERRH
jgi:hypothetical protein